MQVFPSSDLGVHLQTPEVNSWVVKRDWYSADRRKNITEITVLLLLMSYDRAKEKFRWRLSDSSAPVEADRGELTKFFSADIAADIFEVSWPSEIIYEKNHQQFSVCDEFFSTWNPRPCIDGLDLNLSLLERRNVDEKTGTVTFMEELNSILFN